MILYFLMSRHNEAAPLIKHYGLKKDMAPCPFPVFLADNVLLCLSGEGRANAAAATAYLLTRWGRDGLFVHLGLAKSALYPHTITEGKERAYQEMLYKPPAFISEGVLEEGEAFYAFMAAARFLPLKQIIVLRIDSIDEGIFTWLETICMGLKAFGTLTFPTSMLKKACRTMK